jgi:transposase
VAIDPRDTSKTCNTCKVIGERKGKHFRCPNCGHVADADVNAAKNIAQLGAIVNRPERSGMMSSTVKASFP